MKKIVFSITLLLQIICILIFFMPLNSIFRSGTQYENETQLFGSITYLPEFKIDWPIFISFLLAAIFISSLLTIMALNLISIFQKSKQVLNNNLDELGKKMNYYRVNTYLSISKITIFVTAITLISYLSNNSNNFYTHLISSLAFGYCISYCISLIFFEKDFWLFSYANKSEISVTLYRLVIILPLFLYSFQTIIFYRLLGYMDSPVKSKIWSAIYSIPQPYLIPLPFLIILIVSYLLSFGVSFINKNHQTIIEYIFRLKPIKSSNIQD